MLYLMRGQISKEGLFHRSRDAGGDAYDCHEAGRARHPGRRHCFWDEVEPFHCFWMGTEISAGRFGRLEIYKSARSASQVETTGDYEAGCLLLKPAMDFGFESDLWTVPRVRVLIKREFGVKLHPKHMPRFLARIGAENTGATGAGTRPQSSVSMEETPFAPDRAIRYRMPWFDPLWRRGFVCIDSSYRQDLDVSRHQADCSSFWKARCSCWRYIGGQPTRTPPFPTLSGEF